MSTVWQPNPAYGLEIPDVTTIIEQPSVFLTDPSVEKPKLGFVYYQQTSASTWTITHNLNFYPNVTVVDSAGTIVEGEISYVSASQVVLTFRSAFSGQAYLS